jgi:hypothetical protein
MPTDRTAFRCQFKLGNKIVRVGVTGNPWFMEGVLRREKTGWDKGRIKIIGLRTTWEAAREWESEQIAKGKPVAA